MAPLPFAVQLLVLFPGGKKYLFLAAVLVFSPALALLPFCGLGCESDVFGGWGLLRLWFQHATPFAVNTALCP